MDHSQDVVGSHETLDPVDTEKNPERDIRGFRWFLVCVAIFSANLLYGLDTTIAGDIQVAVSETFDNISQLGWLGVGFGLGSTVAILPFGKAFATFNAKWVYIVSLVMFAAGSALCGGAPSMSAMIVGRVWAGAGGAGMYIGTLNLVTRIATPKQQPLYISFEGFVYGGGCILGPIVGGLLADSPATWRWAFYLNLVIFGIMSPIYLFALPSLPVKPQFTAIEKAKRLDWLGILLIIALHVSLVLAFTFGGPIWDWDDGRVIALIVLFVVFTAAFAITQAYSMLTTEADRLFPCEFLRDPELVALYIATACGGAALVVAIYYIPLFYLFVKDDSGTRAAIRLIPYVVFYITAIMACGYVMPRVGYHWIWYLGSGIVLTAGGASMFIVDADSPDSFVIGFSLLLGLGLTVSQASYAVATSRVPGARIPEAIQFINISQGQSQMLGLLIASAIFQNQGFEGLKRVLDGQGFPDSEIRAALAGARSKLFSSIGERLRTRCLDVIVETIQQEWILVIVAGAVLALCSLFLSKKRF